MSSTVLMEWYVRGRVLYCRYPETVTYEMLDETIQRTLPFLDEQATVHVIIDAREVKYPPLNLIRIRKTVSILIGRTQGWYLVLTSDPKIRFLALMVAQVVSPHHYRVFASMREAVALLRQQDATIDWSSVDLLGVDDTEPSRRQQ